MEDPQHDGTSSGGSEHTGEPTIDGQEPVPTEAGDPSPAEAGGAPGPSDQAKAADEEHWLSCDACGRWRRVDLPTMREFEVRTLALFSPLSFIKMLSLFGGSMRRAKM